MTNLPRVGFIGWNPFQFLHIKDLAQRIPGAVFIIEKRKNHINNFTKELLYNHNIPIIVWDRAKMAELDGLFDIIICQTLFFRIETFVKTKIIMMQYGYAKEPHNYGAWRSLADLCLTYGNYASKKICHFCPTVTIGNPRYDKWHNSINGTSPITKDNIQRDTKSQKILYIPTWGDLSSIDEYTDEIIELSKKYTVMLKLHHNTDLLEQERKNKIKGHIFLYGANDDILELINESDIIISDYSGAIFDAVYFKKPIILLNNKNHHNNDSIKIDSFSIEFTHRSQLGYEVHNPEELHNAIENVLNNREYYSSIHHSLREELFHDNGDSISLAIKEILALHSGHYMLNQQHLYIRECYKELLATKRKLNIALKNQK
ncbi:CDP-glycerol glycerophosphotransferase family protein [Escherichia coli]